MCVEAKHPKELTEAEITAWRAIVAERPDLSSPYLAPEWAQAVGAVRPDARVVVYRNGTSGEPEAFLAVQRPSGAIALPAGGPVCDYQALICRRDFAGDPAEAAQALGVGRIDFTYGLRSSAIGTCLKSSDAGHVVNFAEGWDAYCAERKSAGSKVISRARKKWNKLVRECGEVTVEKFSSEDASFDQLIAWKREQYARTGVADVFARDWIDQLVRSIRDFPEHGAFGGAMFVLKVRQEAAAMLFCLRSGKTLHAWFTAYDPALAEHSPGLLLFVEAIRAAAEAGYEELDLGAGDYPFKQSLANSVRETGAGFIGRPGLTAASRAAQYRLRALIESLPVGRARQWPAKAMRRLDLARGMNCAA